MTEVEINGLPSDNREIDIGDYVELYDEQCGWKIGHIVQMDYVTCIDVETGFPVTGIETCKTMNLDNLQTYLDSEYTIVKPISGVTISLKD